MSKVVIHNRTREDDLHELEMMHLRDTGTKMIEIGKKFEMTKNAVIGKLYRIKDGEVRECSCLKPENKNGGMPEKWWAK